MRDKHIAWLIVGACAGFGAFLTQRLRSNGDQGECRPFLVRKQTPYGDIADEMIKVRGTMLALSETGRA